MPAVELDRICKSFGSHSVLKDISFSVRDGEYVVVLGPSGCGKTTLLKTLAGIYQPESGRVLIDGVDVTCSPPEERGIGFFFQHYALFPHMTVRQNVGYSLTVRGIDACQIDRIVDEKLKMVGLKYWEGNYPNELSGGMQQRVALARVLASGSKLLLLDEPLNALDAKIAALLRKELRDMAKNLGLTVLHVTPNQEEAIELADRIMLMKDGVFVQAGTNVESYVRPKTPYGAYFMGDSNFLGASRVGSYSVDYDGIPFAVKSEVFEDNVVLAIRSEKIRFRTHENNTLQGVVEHLHFLGKRMMYEINYKGKPIYVETSKHSKLKIGDVVHLYFPPEDLMVFGSGEKFDDEITVI